MQNTLQVFENQEFGKIRVIDIRGNPWWVLKDVCSALGIRNHKMTAQRLDEDEVSLTDLIDSLGRSQQTSIISESGLYAVILRSDKPKAKEFRKWTTSKVLPSIRKHGAYINDEVLRRMQEDSEFNTELLRNLAAEQRLNIDLANKVARLAPKAHYHDIILNCPDALAITNIAKDYGMSAMALNKLLHSMRIQHKIGGVWVLYREHHSFGYTVTHTCTKNGVTAWMHTYWTQRGRFFLYEQLKAHGVLPVIEQMNESEQISLDNAV